MNIAATRLINEMLSVHMQINLPEDIFMYIEEPKSKNEADARVYGKEQKLNLTLGK